MKGLTPVLTGLSVFVMAYGFASEALKTRTRTDDFVFVALAALGIVMALGAGLGGRDSI